MDTSTNRIEVIKMKKIGNGKNALTVHIHGDYQVIKNGTREYPWNIYDQKNNIVGFGRTLCSCIKDIDNGCFD